MRPCGGAATPREQAECAKAGEHQRIGLRLWRWARGRDRKVPAVWTYRRAVGAYERWV